MKTALLAIASLCLSIPVFGQGTVIFENADSAGLITLYGNVLQPGTYTLGLLFSPSTSGNVSIGTMTQIALYMPNVQNNGDGPGYFYDPNVITTPSGSGKGSFALVGWLGSYQNIEAAYEAGSVVSYSSEFVSNMGQ